jgi:SAM-dependent methyltransferase
MAKSAKPPKKPKKSPKLAKTADRYSLYEQSVQAPDVDVKFFSKVYRSEYKRKPKVLREDFCGTASVCAEWVKLGPEHVAFGVDLDPEPLEWGRIHNLGKLQPKQQARVQLIEGDVREVKTAPADIVAAQNFSYCVFETRDELRKYFRSSLEAIADEGIMVLDLFGGYESMEDEREEVTEHDGFDYVWEQHRFDPITHHGVYKIHFRFPDRSELKDAFVYEWRLWTIPEVREVLREAGFSRADAYWEGTDEESGEGTGVYHKREQGECDPAWNAYIVGVK